jgi:hypothetical protein
MTQCNINFQRDVHRVFRSSCREVSSMTAFCKLRALHCTNVFARKKYTFTDDLLPDARTKAPACPQNSRSDELA